LSLDQRKPQLGPPGPPVWYLYQTASPQAFIPGTLWTHLHIFLEAVKHKDCYYSVHNLFLKRSDTDE
jgi:hypothetical protein